MKEKTAFVFTLRIPAWCNDLEIQINDKVLKKFTIEKGMVKLERKFEDGDRIQLNLPMETKLTACGSNNKGVAIEQGPLVYSLKVENKTICFPYIGDAKLGKFPNKLMYPTSDWSYALNMDNRSKAELGFSDTGNKYPWDIDNTPLKIKVAVKK